MAWPKKNPGSSPATHTYEGGNRASLVADAPTVRSTNVPLSGAGGKNGGYKPAYSSDSAMQPIASMAKVSKRGGYLGQGGFARLFKGRPGEKPANIGASGAAPSGSLSGVFGY